MLRFVPHYESVPWGGRRLAEELGRTIPDGPVGESWELSEVGDRHSRVSEGPFAGQLLGDLWRRGLLGGSAKGAFPFLLKWLDTNERLSVQVHPDEATCARTGKGQPKTEAWYVLSAEPGAVLLAGHYPGLDAATLKVSAQGGTVHKWLYEITAKPGDMFLVPAGTLHALGGGFLLLEVQQPSDTTYRVYDWGRFGLDGRPRQLHLEDACEAVVFSRHGAPKPARQEISGPTFVMRSLRTGIEVPLTLLRVFVADDAETVLTSERGDTTLAYGDVVVAQPEEGRVRVTKGTAVLISEPSGP